MKSERNKKIAQIFAIISEINKTRLKPKKSLAKVLVYAFAKKYGCASLKISLSISQLTNGDIFIFTQYLKEILVIRRSKNFKND